MCTSGTYKGRTHGGTYSAAKYGLVYIYIYTTVWRATSGRRTPRRTADTPADGGRADTPAGGGQADTGGALYYG